jgi:hypothetical protein
MLATAGLACCLGTAVSGDEPSSATAEGLMQNAHDGRAEWKNFPGFTARIQASTEGATTEGRIVVSRDGTVDLQFTQPQGFEWVERSVKSLVGHRLPTGEAIRDVEFADDQTAHPHGRLLKSTGPNGKNFWRVQGDVLTEVQRISKESRFTISVSDVWRNAEQKHLPRNFVVTTWEMPSDKIKSVRQVNQEWTRIGEFDLPVRYWALTHRSDGPSSTQEIKFADHKISISTTNSH